MLRKEPLYYRAMTKQETVSGYWGVLVQVSQLERVVATEEETAEEAATATTDKVAIAEKAIAGKATTEKAGSNR